MKKLTKTNTIIISILALIALVLIVLKFAPTAHAASWDTAGNVVTTGQFLGTTNNTAFTIKTANQDKITILPTPPGNPAGNTEVRVQAGTLFSLQNQMGQFILNHASPTGCTALYGGISVAPKYISLCNDGITISGGGLNFKTNYTIASNTAYTLTATDDTVEMESGDFILPDATTANKGKSYTMINTGAGDIAVHVYSGGMIGNFKQEAQYIINSDEYVTVRSNGAIWRVMK